MKASCSFAWQVLPMSLSLPASPAANDKVRRREAAAERRGDQRLQEKGSKGGKVEATLKMQDQEGGSRKEKLREES